MPLPFIVRLPGNTSTVPTDATAGALPSIATVAQNQQNAIKHARTVAEVAKLRAAHPVKASKKLHRHAAPNTSSIADKGVNLATEITKLPHQIESVVSKSI